MAENQNHEHNEANEQDINELLRQLAQSQGEGDSFAMFGRPALDESKVNETLLNEMVEFQKKITEFEKTINDKLTAWEDEYGPEVLQHSSMKAQEIYQSTL